MYKKIYSFIIICAFFVFINPLFAVTINSNAVTGNWLTGSSWVGGVVPTLNDLAVIVNGSNITVNGNINIGGVQVNSGGTLNASGFNITLYSNWLINGNFNRGTSTVIFNGSGSQSITGSSAIKFENIIINNSNSSPGMGVTAHPVNTFIYGNFEHNGVFNRNNTSFPNVKITFAGNTIISGSANLIVHNIDISVGASLNGATGLSGGSSNMFFTGHWNNMGTFISGNGTVNIQGASSYGTQNITSGGSPFYNLKINKVVTVAPQSNIIVQNNFTILLGIWNASGFNLNVGGGFNNAATFTAGTGLVVLDGSANQNINLNTSALYNFTVNKIGGNVYQSSNIQVTNNLSLTAGVIYTYTTLPTLYQLYVSNNNSATSITGGSSSSCVVGNFKRAIVPGGATYAFPVGVLNTVPLKYRPVTYMQISSAGAVNASMVADTTSSGPFNSANWFVKISTNTGNPTGSINVAYDLATDFPLGMQECIISVIRGQASSPGNWNFILQTVTSAAGGTAGFITSKLPLTLNPFGFILGEPRPVSSSVSICGGSTATLVANIPKGFAHFNWYSNQTGGTLLSADNNSFVSPILNSPTVYYVEYYDSLTGCTSARTADSVQVTLLASSAFSLPDSICLGSLGLITFQGTSSSSASYYWDFDGGIVSIGNGGSNYQVYWNTPGPKNITLTVSDSACSSSLTLHSIQVNPAPSQASLSASNYAVCKGDSVTLTSTGSSGGNTINYNFYDSPIAGTLLGNSPLSLIPADTTTYYLEITNEFGCRSFVSRDSVRIGVYPVPELNNPFSEDKAVCLGDSAQLFIIENLLPAATVYWWDNQIGGNFIALGDSINTGPLFENKVYWVEAITALGCSSGRLPISVLAITFPVTTLKLLNENNNFYTGEAITLVAEPYGYQMYEFYLNGTLIQAGPENLYISNSFRNEDEVTTVAVDYTCRGPISNILTLKVLPIANAFTPDGDGINDVFLKDLDLIIMNRWGQELFRGTQGWDGTFNGKKVSLGTYYYIYKIPTIEGTTSSYTGPVTIVNE